MKRQLPFPVPRPSALRLPPSAFTLVEMLVVITIIGILASMITAAAVVARRRAKIATMVMEVKQLEMACQAYKEKFGEYPPDFAGVDGSQGAAVQAIAQRAVLRHLSRAFPRYRPGVSTNGSAPTQWDAFRADVLGRQAINNPPVYEGWGVDVNTLTPTRALAFWLGGKPDWFVNASNIRIQPGDTGYDPTKPVRGLLGFSADPMNPFNYSASRIRPMFEFDLSRLMINPNVAGNCAFGFRYWPQGASGDMTSGAIVYYRAENKIYAISGVPKSVTDIDDPAAIKPIVYPAIDTRLSNVPGTTNFVSANPITSTWVNPSSFQIFTSGLDVMYMDLSQNGDPTILINQLYFSTGENYAPNTYDDITNFSGGTLEDAIP